MKMVILSDRNFKIFTEIVPQKGVVFFQCSEILLRLSRAPKTP